MRRVARRLVSGDGMEAALAPTDLANEAVVRLIQSRSLAASDQGHMLAIAAQTMRRILIDEARKARAAKRQMPSLMTTWPGGASLIGIEDLDHALEALAQFSAEHARIVELRFSLGMSVEETARATGIPERTVKRRWQAARAWLQDYIHGGDQNA
jgi:RNA polymerase sigma factor (TIGR02999 family)